MHLKDILSTSLSRSHSLYFFLSLSFPPSLSNPYWPLETHIRRLLHSPLPHPLPPPHTTLRTTICPPPQSACGQTQNNNVILPLKDTQAAFCILIFSSLSINSRACYYIYVLPVALRLRKMNKIQPLIDLLHLIELLAVAYLCWHSNMHCNMKQNNEKKQKLKKTKMIIAI